MKLPPPNKSFTGTPSIKYLLSPLLLPRKYPFTTPACKLTILPTPLTAKLSINSLSTTLVVFVAFVLTSFLSRTTLTSSPATDATDITKSTVVVKPTDVLTLDST